MNGACQSVWNSAAVDQFDLSPPKFLEFKADDGTVLYGELVTPPNFTSRAKIPLIVNIYGGPAAQLVTNSRIEDWAGSDGLFHQLLSQKGFAIFTVDNRGTPNRDRKFMSAVRHQYGNNGLPTDKDTISYVDMDLPKIASKLHGSLFLAHGTSDDNVHFQNSVQMIDALIQAGLHSSGLYRFESQAFYPKNPLSDRLVYVFRRAAV
jgi:dipeptidyl aminopeptidase/acylaminoacyl peptidase